MGLDEYARKRTFSKTPEPGPATPEAPAEGRSFCVQRHHARRLHYDLRLEMHGVLKSWAVPKGPTLDPAEKRMAVLVEDHPLEYGGFEGVIPAGNYGAGSVMLWDRGAYETYGDKPLDEQLAAGDLKIRFFGEKLSGDFALVRTKRGKGDEWLLIKKKDASAQAGWDPDAHARSVLTGRTQEEIARGLPAKSAADAEGVSALVKDLPGAQPAPMPTSIRPMMSFATEKPPSGPDWVHEIKWDGVRAICFLKPEGIRLVSRTGNPCEAQYPELTALRHYIGAREAVLDGEIAVLDEKGRPSFERIQPRIHITGAHTIANLARTHPAVYFVFDLIYADGYDLRKTPLGERKRVLEQILEPGPIVRYSAHFPGDGAAILEAARQTGLEGIISKQLSSPYESRRSASWLKVKNVSRQDVVICGFTKGERGAWFGALVAGVYEGDKLVWAGNVGTGFDHALLASIHERLLALATDKPVFEDWRQYRELRDVTWVRPELVCEVKFANWTQDGRLRAPVFLGLRTDVEPRECVRETDVTRTVPSPAPAPQAPPSKGRIPAIPRHAYPRCRVASRQSSGAGPHRVGRRTQ